jgi:hypothetical protein
MRNKTKFDSELRERLAKYHPGVPFWASGPNGLGHPLDARLVFVGYNPSSPPPKPWLTYWDAVSGFDMARYDKDNPKKPSRTRRNIYRIAAETLRPDITFVNTNIIWEVSSRKNHLKSAIPGDFEWLLGCLSKEVVIVAHGKDAKQVLEDRAIPFFHLSGFGWPRGKVRKTEFDRLKGEILARL